MKLTEEQLDALRKAPCLSPGETQILELLFESPPTNQDIANRPGTGDDGVTFGLFGGPR